jgi:hypothetical protein
METMFGACLALPQIHAWAGWFLSQAVEGGGGEA